MNIKLIAMAVIGTLVVGGTTSAEPVGMGQASCGVWTTWHVTEFKPNEPLTDDYIFQQQWLRGYLAAYTDFVMHDTDILEGTDFLGATSWMNSYCQAHPLDNVDQAAKALIAELVARKNH